MKIKHIIALLAVAGVVVCSAGWAEDTTTSAAEKPAQPKVKGLDMVTDVVGDVGNKAVALVSGKLDVTMESDKDRLTTKKDYTYNALGQKIPKATSVKTGRSLHSE